MKPVEAAALPKGEGLLLPKLILLDPNEKAPPCLTPLVLAKLEPMEGTFAGEEEGKVVDSLSSSFDSSLSPEFVVDPKPNRKALFEAELVTGDGAGLVAEPKENVELEASNGEEFAGAELANGLEEIVLENVDVVKGADVLSTVVETCPFSAVSSDLSSAIFPSSSPSSSSSSSSSSFPNVE